MIGDQKDLRCEKKPSFGQQPLNFLSDVLGCKIFAPFMTVHEIFAYFFDGFRIVYSSLWSPEAISSVVI